MTETAPSRPLTILITRRVFPGREGEYEATMDEMIVAAGGFAGHLGGYVVRPASGDLYHTLFAFDSEAHRRAWMESAERASRLERIRAISDDVGESSVLTGLETWFSVPASKGRAPPPKYKMAFVSWLGIFPLVLILSNTVAPWLAPIHPVLGVFGVTLCVVLAMTWVVMPLLARAFARWLYPPRP